ncbi:AaceriAGR105Cp [[Ashbya] aceris (nom. inval.)]|nr:AaceriAGR105Cp [[Ashbya] aceris (nom. inval.)]
MELKWEQLKTIVLDEDEFINYYSNHIATMTGSSGNSREFRLKKLVIPRRSFTALQLSSASPNEISMSARSVLLGGIPELWYANQSKNVIKSMSKMVQNKTKGKLRHAYTIGQAPLRNARDRLSLRGKKYVMRSSEATRNLLNPTTRERASDSQMRRRLCARTSVSTNDSSAVSGETNLKLPVSHHGGHSLAPTSFSMTDNSTLNQGTINVSETSNLDTRVESGTIHPIPNVKFEMASSSLNSTTDIMSLLLRLKHTESEQSSTCDSESVYCSAKEFLKITGECTTDRSLMNHDYISGQSIMTVEASHIREGDKSNLLSTGISKEKDEAPKGSGTSKIKFEITSEKQETQTIKSPEEELKVLKPEPERLPYSKKKLLSSCPSWDEPMNGTWGVAQRAKSLVIHEWNLVKAKEHELKNRYFNRFRTGEILMMEKMLVLVKSAVSVTHPPTTFSDVEPIDTRVYGRWKELVVLARATGDPDAPIFMQFLDRSGLPKIEKCSHSTKSMDFSLTESCSVGYYNCLDRTIYILKPDEKLESDLKEGTISAKCHRYKPLKIYILKCSTLWSSGKWLSFLRESIGLQIIPDSIDIHLPQTKMTLTVALPPQALKEMKEQAHAEEAELKVLELKNGYKVITYPILRYMGIVIRNILMEAGYTDIVRNWEKENSLMGFSWKRYDMLEWVLGDQIDALYGSFIANASQVLEYRPLTAYPRTVELEGGSCLIEPPPIEGFLALCSHKYRDGVNGSFNRRFIKLKYMFTCNGVLFYTRGTKAMPPLPAFNAPTVYGAQPSPLLEDVVGYIPDIYEHNPYPLDQYQHIRWLTDDLTPEEFQEFDEFALKSAARKVAHILKAEGAIDLTQIESISTLDIEEACRITKSIRIWNGVNNLFWKTQSSVDDTSKSLIVVNMKNGSKMQLLAPSISMAKEWIKRLTLLSEYWTERLHKDQEVMWTTKMANLKMLRIQEQNEFHILGNTPRWVNERGYASDAIYNVSSYTVLRPLIHQGILYQKPRKHSVFKKCFLTLVPGFIVLYECFKRSMMGYSYKTVAYHHYMTVPLEDCYIYSGNITSQDLLKREREFNSGNPGNRSLPRVYQDGWKSLEDEPYRCFTLWFGNKAVSDYTAVGKHTDSDEVQNNIPESGMHTQPLTASGNFENQNDQNAGKRYRVSGKSMVFMARSRQDRDVWIYKIHCELERIKQGCNHKIKKQKPTV